MNYVSFKTSRNFCLGVVNIFYEWSNITLSEAGKYASRNKEKK